MPKHKQNTGFTLIELLVVIVVISIIAAVGFVALNPFARFRNARDAKRWSDVSIIFDAIKVDKMDNGGGYLEAIANLLDGQVYMIGTDTVSCDDYNDKCDIEISSDENCVNLNSLVDQGYLKTAPISPNGAGDWTAGHTGYTLSIASTTISVRACESENTDEIFISR